MLVKNGGYAYPRPKNIQPPKNKQNNWYNQTGYACPAKSYIPFSNPSNKHGELSCFDLHYYVELFHPFLETKQSKITTEATGWFRRRMRQINIDKGTTLSYILQFQVVRIFLFQVSHVQDRRETWWSMGPTQSGRWCFGCCNACNHNTRLVAHLSGSHCSCSRYKPVSSTRVAMVSWTCRSLSKAARAFRITV